MRALSSTSMSGRRQWDFVKEGSKTDKVDTPRNINARSHPKYGMFPDAHFGEDSWSSVLILLDYLATSFACRTWSLEPWATERSCVENRESQLTWDALAHNKRPITFDNIFCTEFGSHQVDSPSVRLLVPNHWCTTASSLDHKPYRILSAPLFKIEACFILQWQNMHV